MPRHLSETRRGRPRQNDGQSQLDIGDSLFFPCLEATAKPGQASPPLRNGPDAAYLPVKENCRKSDPRTTGRATRGPLGAVPVPPPLPPRRGVAAGLAAPGHPHRTAQNLANCADVRAAQKRRGESLCPSHARSPSASPPGVYHGKTHWATPNHVKAQ